MADNVNVNPQGENIPVPEQLYHHQQTDHGFFTGLLSQHQISYPAHQLSTQIPSSKQNPYIPPPPPLTQHLPNAIITSNHHPIPSAHQQPQMSSCQKTCMSGVGHYGNPNSLLHGLINQQPLMYAEETPFPPMLSTNHALTHMTMKPFPPPVNQLAEPCQRLPYSAPLENNLPNSVSVHNSDPYSNFSSKPDENVDNSYMEYLTRRVQKSEALDADIVVTVLKPDPLVYLIAFERELEILKAMTIEHLKNLTYSFVSELEPNVTAISTVDDILIIPQTENNETIYKILKVEPEPTRSCPSENVSQSPNSSINLEDLSTHCVNNEQIQSTDRNTGQNVPDPKNNETTLLLGELLKTNEIGSPETKSVGKVVREGLDECNRMGENDVDSPHISSEEEPNVISEAIDEIDECIKEESNTSVLSDDINVPNIPKPSRSKANKEKKRTTRKNKILKKLKRSTKGQSSFDVISEKTNEESVVDVMKKRNHVKNNKKTKVKKMKEEVSEEDEDTTPKKSVEEPKKQEKKSKLFCEVCESDHKHGECILLCPRIVVKDRHSCKNATYNPIITLPLQLYLVPSEDGIFTHAAETIQRGTQFGPLVCQEVEFKTVERSTDLTHLWIWRDYNKDEKEGFEELRFFSSESEMKSNWCRFLKLSLVRSESNLIQIIRGDRIYFVTQKCVAEGEKLMCYVPYFDELPARLHSDLEMNYKSTQKCPKCELYFDSFLNFVKHCRIIHPRGITRTKCECRYCGIKVNCFRELRDHAKEAHADIASFDCHICGKFLQSTSSLRSHMKGVHRQVPPSTCDVCGKVFHTRSKYRSHIRDYHSSTFYKCESCGKEFKMRACYHRHKKTHTMDFRFACDRCGKCFRDGHNLKVHLLTHSGKRPFQCSIRGCDAAFTTKQCLQIHYRKNHGCSDEKIPEITRQVPFTFEAHGVTKTVVTEPKKEGEDLKTENNVHLHEQDFMDFVIAQHSQLQ